MKSPIKKLLVLTNQSFCDLFSLQMFWQLKKQICKNIRNIQYTTFADIHFSDFSSFIFEVTVEKVVIDAEELHGIEIDGILNLQNLLEQCSSIKDVGIWK